MKEIDFSKPIETVASSRPVERVEDRMVSGDYQFRFTDAGNVTAEDGFGFYTPQHQDGIDTFYADEFGREFYGYGAGYKEGQRIDPILRNVKTLDAHGVLQIGFNSNWYPTRLITIAEDGNIVVEGARDHSSAWFIFTPDGDFVTSQLGSGTVLKLRNKPAPLTRTSNKTVDGVPIIITYVDDVATKVELA